MNRRIALILLAAAGMTPAQTPQPQPGPRPVRPAVQQPGPRPQGERPFWEDPQMAERLGLSPEQRNKLADLALQHRLVRVDLNAAREKAQIALDPLINAAVPNEAQVMAQVDRVVQAEGAIRKDEIKMQLEVRQLLTPDQWRRVREDQLRRTLEFLKEPNPGQPGPPQR